MYFHKIHHPANFAFAQACDDGSRTLAVNGANLAVAIADLGGDVHRLSLTQERWVGHGSQAELAASVEGASRHRLGFDHSGKLTLQAASGDGASQPPVLQGKPGTGFGVCGQAWLFQFQLEKGMQFYGLGEHSRGLEKSGQRVKFWNTDLFGDFATCEIRNGYANPMYVAIPWLIVKRDNHYIGILVHNPGAVFMDLASNFVWNEHNREDIERGSFYVGAPDGNPELYFIVGPSLPELVKKFQTLVGRTPRPPLWALGHHQCRWGYGGAEDLERLDRRFRERGIPCDGLWLDIDYMDRYQVFTFSREHWRDDAHVREVLADLASRGRRVVPILDPGVKAERGYAVCDEGLAQDLFCRNPEGLPYVGFVWPGKTYFPDFSLPEARTWWAAHVRAFAEKGIAGAWIDMNDPATGAVELNEMRFARGTQPHAYYHNQYALGMAQATRAGFLAARPDERPFLLSRSAYLSSSRFTAVWTGDNVSNWHHLKMAIPLSLGLALSGIPFNGPDVCGFMYDTNPELAVAWYKAGFLFPFFRNHTSAGTKLQEPWELGESEGRVIAHFIRLRYKLLPYLYQLFVAQEETGEALLRPLFHDFEDTAACPLGAIDDEFLIGPAFLQAPVLTADSPSREVRLPAGPRWFSVMDGTWNDGGKTLSVTTEQASTPLYVREGSLVPMQPGERTDASNDFATVEVHCFLSAGTRSGHALRYVCDDGSSFAYRRGESSELLLEASVENESELRISIRKLNCGFRALRVRFVAYHAFARVTLQREGVVSDLPLSSEAWRFTGAPLPTWVTEWQDLA